MRTNLSPTQRLDVLNAAQAALRKECPEAFAPDRAGQFGQAASLDLHLDRLIHIVRQTTATPIEPFLAEMMDDLCATCPAQAPNGVCPLRLEEKCVLFTHAPAIRDAIADALRAMEDPQYLAAHRSEEPNPVMPA